MPVLPYVENACQLAIKHTSSTEQAFVTLHMLGPSGFNSGDLDELCELAFEQWATRMLPGMPFNTVAESAAARGIRGEGDALGSYLPAAPIPGAITNATARPQEAVCLKLSTGLSGKGFRGRMFVPGVPNNVVEVGLIESSYRIGRATALTGWLTWLKGNTNFEPVIISYYREKVLRAIPVVTPIQQAESITRYPSNLASRTPGSGQ